MPTDFELHSAFIELAKNAFAEQAYEPTDAILMASAKNLARLKTPASAFAHLTPDGNFGDLLKSLAHV